MKRNRSTKVIIVLLSITSIAFCQYAYPDATAYADRLFEYRIDRLSLTDASVKITESGRRSLPNWLHVDYKSNSIKGIPSERDKGTYIIEVGRELFAITVTTYSQNEVAEPSTSHSKPYSCSPKESVTLVKVFINVDLNVTKLSQRIDLVETLSEGLKLHSHQIQLQTCPPNEQSEKSAVLVSGAGDQKRDISKPSASVSWIVGCGAVKSHQMEILERLETMAKNGSMSKQLGHSVTSWEVLINKPLIVTSRRLKRQVAATNTPIPVTEPGSTDGITTKPQTVTPSSTIKESTSVSTTPLSSTTQSTTSSTTSSTTTSSTSPPDEIISTPLIITTPPTPPPPPPPSSSTTQSTTSPTTFPSTELTTKPTATTQSSSITEPATSAIVKPDGEETTTIELPTPPPVITPPPSPRNSPPMFNPQKEQPIKHHLTSGKLYEYTVDSTLFLDPEDDDISYTVYEYSTGSDVNTRPTWIWFDNVRNKLIALPQDKHSGSSRYQLRATDSKGAYTQVDMSFMVHDKSQETVTQFYHALVGKPFENNDRHILAVMVEMNKRIDNSLELREVYEDATGTAVVFGKTLPIKLLICPSNDNSATLEKLRAMKMLDLPMLQSAVRISSVRSEPVKPCQNTRPQLTSLSSVISQFTDYTTVTRGQLFELIIPPSFFTDEEDVDLNGMKLELITDGIQPTDSSWIKLYDNPYRLKGLTWNTEASAIESIQYTLQVTDAGGLSDEYQFTLNVAGLYYDLTHKFTLTVDENYSEFANDLDKQLMLMDKLQNVFEGQSVIFHSVTQGSVLVEFSVKNDAIMQGDDNVCAETAKLSKKVFVNGEVTDSFVESTAPFQVTKVTFTPEGECQGQLEPIEARVKKPEAGEGKEEKSFNILYVIIPLVVILVAVIVIMIIICLIKNRRKKKMDVSTNNGTYIEKGVPVIFEEEMKDIDKKDAAETKPLMEETKPAPPAYPQNGKETTPLKSHPGNEYQPPTPPASEHGAYDRSP